jgi:RNA polymerase sigma-70 factor (ECF subfamily)
MNACFQGNRVVTETSTNLRNTKTDKVFRRIRQMIIDLEFRPGAVIQKEQLTSLFGVSRAPINEALARLSEEQRVTISLFYLEHNSYEQIISVTGYTFMQVKSYIQNGKRNLKILMTKHEHEQ